jgi:hypothetical protein
MDISACIITNIDELLIADENAFPLHIPYSK